MSKPRNAAGDGSRAHGESTTSPRQFKGYGVTERKCDYSSCLDSVVGRIRVPSMAGQNRLFETSVD